MHHTSNGVAGEAKANDQLITYDNFASHAGVAEPLSEEEYHKELNKPTDRVRNRLQPSTTTPREGLSTWVLLSESNSPTSTESKKEIVNTTKRPFTTTTTRRPATTSARKPMTTVRRRTTTNTRASTVTEEKKEKINKFMTRIKVAEGPKPKLEDTSVTITKKPKKPFAPTTRRTTTTTPAPTTTTTELTMTESPLATTATDDLNSDNNEVETATFLILEPKDAMFDLPEDRSPSRVTKKKPSRKPTAAAATKKKPASKKKKPEEKDAGLKPSVKKPPVKNQPMTAQIMNYLSREVMPTVGVGLVGLIFTAGLASFFLGSPLTAALRRSDEATNRKDDIYYSNYEDYATSDGQNEEEVFGKLIAGMPDRSYYRNTLRRRVSQPARTGHQYGNYHVQSYSGNKYPQISYRNRPAYPGTPEMYANYNRQGQAKSHNEFYYNTPPSFNTKQSSPVYAAPESTTASTTTTTHGPLTSAEPVSEEMIEDLSEQDHELLPNPAAYTAEHSPEHHAQYVVGSVYHQDNSMIDIITSAPVPEHGPRRRKRDVTVASEENEIDNEIDNEISVNDEKKPDDISTTTSASSPLTTTETVGIDTFIPTTEGEKGEAGSTPVNERPISWSDLIRDTVEMKLVVGINLLQHVTSQFQRYLNGMQHRVEEHFNHTVVQQ